MAACCRYIRRRDAARKLLFVPLPPNRRCSTAALAAWVLSASASPQPLRVIVRVLHRIGTYMATAKCFMTKTSVT